MLFKQLTVDDVIDFKIYLQSSSKAMPEIEGRTERIRNLPTYLQFFR